MTCKQDIVIAGVGGHGVLTIAAILGRLAVHEGYNLRQSEVHGMSQRGGIVQAHLRVSSQEIHSDLIPHGRGNVLIATEPLEALRCVDYLGPESVVFSSGTPLVNCSLYPDLDLIYEEIYRSGAHALVDAPALAHIAGNRKSTNIVVLGAASVSLCFQACSYYLFMPDLCKCDINLLKTNVAAFELGRRAATVYMDLLDRGLVPRKALERSTEEAAEAIVAKREFEQIWRKWEPIMTPQLSFYIN